MPTEKKEPKHPRLNNKANRARHEKENQQIRILKIAGIAVFGLIALTLIFGGLFASVTSRITNANTSFPGYALIMLCSRIRRCYCCSNFCPG